MAVLEKATLGGGCFWCLEAVFQRLDGVHGVVSGYAGGQTQDPTYRDICTGQTGHAEVVQVCFDAEKITYQTLLDWFWRAHDPTTLNRQGADVGTMYRSIVLSHNDRQQTIAQALKAALGKANRFPDPIITEIKILDTFYPAELNHQDYYNSHKQASYCTFVIEPKLAKLDLEI